MYPVNNLVLITNCLKNTFCWKIQIQIISYSLHSLKQRSFRAKSLKEQQNSNNLETLFLGLKILSVLYFYFDVVYVNK